MEYENPLDHLIRRFQHRWETNAQFRAAMSGVLGLGLIIFLCVGVAGVNAGATRVLAAVGLGGAGNRDQGNLDPGGQIINGNWTFYTPTVPDWKSGGTPGSSPIPNSQTPQPSPTPTATPLDAPTATPCKSNCGGNKGTITATYSPATWIGTGPNASITFTTSSPNAAINVIVNYPGATILSASEIPPCPASPYCSPRNSGPTGTVTWPLGQRPAGLPSCHTGQFIRVVYSANLGGQVYGPDLRIPCGG